MRRLTVTLTVTLALGACLPRGPEAPTGAASAQTLAPPQPFVPQPFGPQRAEDEPANPLRPAGDGDLSVQIGALLLSGPAPEEVVDLAGIAAEVAYNAGHLQRCYEDRVREVPGLHGEIEIHAHIEPSGAVSGQCIGGDTVADPVLVDCVNTVIARGRYPRGHADTVDVVVPFRFTPPSPG